MKPIIKQISLTICALLLNSLALYAAPFVYVANGGDIFGGPGSFDTVYVIDTATNDVIATVNIGATTCYNAIAVTPDGKTVLVGAGDGTNGIVARIDVATNTHLLPDITLSGSPESLAILPNGRYAYVTCDDNTVNRINLTTNAIDAVISGFVQPLDITAAPDSLTVYVNSFSLTDGETVVPINVSDNSLGTAVPAVNACWMAVSLDNKYLYVANVKPDGGLPQGVQQYDLTDPLAPVTATFINLASLMARNLLPGLALTADSKTLYATDNLNSTVIPIDLSNPLSPVIHAAVPVGANPWIIAITPDGNSAYVSDNGTSGPGTVTELNITNRLAPTVVATIDIGNNPAGLAITPPAIPPITSIFPPTSVSGCKTCNVFLFQTDFINNITWTAPEYGEAPVSYNIYRDPALTDLIATVPASSPLQYYDHDRQPNVVYSYYITSIDAYGNQSTAASVTVTQPC